MRNWNRECNPSINFRSIESHVTCHLARAVSSDKDEIDPGKPPFRRERGLKILPGRKSPRQLLVGTRQGKALEQFSQSPERRGKVQRKWIRVVIQYFSTPYSECKRRDEKKAI